MLSHSNEAHPFCQSFVQELNDLSWNDIKKAEDTIRQFFSDEGNIPPLRYNEELAKNQIHPMDIIPKVISSEKWNFIKKGLSQRVIALNMFLNDIYTDEKILKDKIIPKDIIYESPYFLKAMKGEAFPFGFFASFCAPEIVRVDQSFFVLKDNVRSPFGISYMLLCRQLMRRIFPLLFRKCNVRNIDNYTLKLLRALTSLSEKENPTIVLLSPGPYHSAYFEHSFLASQMGIELVQTQDLIFDNQGVYMQTIKTPKKVDIVYNRMDDIFLTLLKFRSESGSHAQKLFSACKFSETILKNAPGSGLADDRAVYSYIPAMIKYYLNEKPLLGNIPSLLCREKKSLKYSLENLPHLIIKSIHTDEEMIGPASSEKEISNHREKIKLNPNNYIAQPVPNISTAPCFINGSAKACHISFKTFVSLGKNFKVDFSQGGFCRSAIKKESLIAQSQHWNQLKDLWILDNSQEEGTIGDLNLNRE